MPQLEVGGSHTQPRLKVVVAAVSTPTWGSCLLHSPLPRGWPLAQHTNPGTRCHPLATINTRWHQPPRTALSQPRAWFNQRKELADRQGHSSIEVQPTAAWRQAELRFHGDLRMIYLTPVDYLTRRLFKEITQWFVSVLRWGSKCSLQPRGRLWVPPQEDEGGAPGCSLSAQGILGSPPHEPPRPACPLSP